VLGNDGTLLQSNLFPKAGRPIALNLLKQLCFLARMPRIFFIVLVRRKLKNFENHCTNHLTTFAMLLVSQTQHYMWTKLGTV